VQSENAGSVQNEEERCKDRETETGRSWRTPGVLQQKEKMENGTVNVLRIE